MEVGVNIELTLILKKNIERKVGKSRMPKHPTPPGFPSFLGGDPSAGSPTDTLLRLNPPCRRQARIPHYQGSLTHPQLRWFDGRCVQGAGAYSPRLFETRLLPNPAS